VSAGLAIEVTRRGVPGNWAGAESTFAAGEVNREIRQVRENGWAGQLGFRSLLKYLTPRVTLAVHCPTPLGDGGKRTCADVCRRFLSLFGPVALLGGGLSSVKSVSISMLVIVGLVVGGFVLASLTEPSPGPSPASLFGLMLLAIGVTLQIHKKSRSRNEPGQRDRRKDNE